MASTDGFPRFDGREIDLVIKARLRALAAVNEMTFVGSAFNALALIDSALSARANAMASGLAVIDSALIARANAMAPAVAAIDSALTARANAMATLAAMKLNVPQVFGEVVDRPITELRMTVIQEQHHDSEAKDTEIRRLRRRVRFLEARLRRDGTVEYDWDDHSLPWATEEG